MTMLFWKLKNAVLKYLFDDQTKNDKFYFVIQDALSYWIYYDNHSCMDLRVENIIYNNNNIM